jgi:hypothetical protein
MKLLRFGVTMKLLESGEWPGGMLATLTTTGGGMLPGQGPPLP